MLLTLRHLFILGMISLWWSTSALASFEEGQKAYDNGNYAEALKQWQPLAQQGDAYTQNSLGAMYQDGFGVTKDDAQAIEWYRKAAEQGSAYAQFNLGLIYIYSETVAEDPAQAVIWFRKAADQGLTGAQFYLGMMYDMGKGIAKDQDQAMVWYRKAVNKKLAAAQYALGYKYANGDGVEKDEAMAVFWLRKAAKQGFPSAKEALEEMKAKENLSITPSLPQPAEVTAAIHRAMDFIDIEGFNIHQHMKMRLLSANVLKVPGCVYESKQKVNCIVQIDYGMDTVSYVQLPLEFHYNRWEAPILENLEDEDSSNPAIPSPTIEQAQESIRQFAKSNTDNTS